MIKLAGFEITRIADTPWQKRVRFDGRESRYAIYNDDLEMGLRMSIVEYPLGSVEPRHVHPGTHATTVVKGRALIDGLTLKPLDCILGPSHEPHGPLEYPDSCTLFSCFQGSNDHSAVTELSTEKNYRLVQAESLPWAAGAHEGIDGIFAGGRRADRGWGDAWRWHVGPVRLVFCALCNPTLEQILLCGGELLVRISRRHEVVRGFREQALHQFARVGLAGDEGFLRNRLLTHVEAELGLTLIAVGAGAGAGAGIGTTTVSGG